MGISTLHNAPPARGQVYPAGPNCTFAHLGTFGHECGKPALFVRSRPSERTVSGWFHAARCGDCAYIIGGENSGLSSPEPYEPAQHVHVWR